MNWTHLPVAGGLYDQDPKLLEEWHHIFSRQGVYEDAKKQKDSKHRKH